MGIFVKYKDLEIGVGDVIKVTFSVKEKDKARLQVFEGILIAINGTSGNKSITVRRIGIQKIGIERIFPLTSPTVNKIEVVKKGSKGVGRSKIYYVRKKSRREIDRIYSRFARKK